MFRKFYKYALGLILAFSVFPGAGCTFFAQMSKDSLAEYVVEAVAGNDKQALWDVLAPEVQDQFLAGSFNEEDKAQENLLMVVKLVCLKVHGIDPDKLAGNEDLQKELAGKLAADENFFIKMNWIWYIGGR